MEKINNLNIYLSRMDKTLYDKCWWIDKIDDSIDTVVDFGCATGNLYNMIVRLSGDKYRYIGIDNSAEMKEQFKANGEFYSSLEEALPHFNPKTTILVLNSVIHEIFSYVVDPEDFIKKILNVEFQYIAIRDMYKIKQPFSDLDPLFYWYYRNVIELSNWSEQWQEFLSYSTHLDDLNNQVKEFLLKYFYAENWERECKEKYLHPWEHYFTFMVPHYQIEFENEFYIPYIRNKIYKDFGFWYDEPTHKKMLLHWVKEKHI